MIKKRIFLGLLLIIMISTGVFANTVIDNTNTNQVVSVSSSQVTTGSEFYLILNLANISFSKFKVDIVNTASLPMNEVTSEVASLSTNNVATTFTVDKSVISLDKLGIIFTSPNEPSKIKFEVTITSLDTTVESLKEDLKIKNGELSSYEEQLKVVTSQDDITKINGLISATKNEISELEKQILEFKAETIKTELTVDVIEKQQNNMGKEEFDKEELEKEFEKEFEREIDKSKKEMNEMSEKMQNLQMNLDDAKSTISSLTQNVTYQGSQNNYLKSLSITGIEFDSNFKKTTDTYFATIDKTVEKVTVNATAEDSTAIVTIYGNTNLQDGKNKILITVTAEDGSTRIYKIYITK